MVRRAKNNVIRVDLSDVESQGRFREDGEYPLEVVAATKEKGDKYDYISWELKCIGEPAGAKVWNNTSLSPQSLWNLRAMLEALGVDIPDEEFDLDLEEMPGLKLTGVVELEESGEYKGKPRLADFYEYEEPKGGKKSSSKKKDDDEDDEKPARGKRDKKKEPASITEDDIGDMSQDELQDVIDEHGLDVDLADFKTLRKMQAAVVDAAQEADILSEGDGAGDAEEDEEDEKPSRSRRSRGKKDEEEDDEEEEKPSRSRRRRSAKEEPEEDEEDERPSRRSRRSRR